MKKATLPNDTTYSQRRAKLLTEESDRIHNIFQANNFYDNSQLNILKLRKKILEAKRSLLASKGKDKTTVFLEKLEDSKSKHASLNSHKTKKQ